MTASLDRERQLAIIAEASRAPSAHNTQPARWRFTDDGAVLLFEDPSRRLDVGDPTGRDQCVSLGCAFEGMRLALSHEGWRLGPPVTPPPTDPRTVTVRGATLGLVARARITTDDARDPLAEQVSRRRTYRGRFPRAGDEARREIQAIVAGRPDVHGILDPLAIASLAELSDAVSFELFARPAYQAELYGWIRFSPRHPAWSVDGLTGECLGLSALERAAGPWLFHPRRFRRLARLGLHRFLVAEASRTRTATALVVVTRPRGPIELTAGMQFYRLWLELTAAGCDARPMSALVDDASAQRAVRAACDVPASAELVNVLAVGPRDPAWQAVSPRLPADDLLV